MHESTTNKILFLQGSSRSEGDTHRVVNYLRNQLDADFIDLLQKNIGRFDYEFRNSGDDFLPLMRKIVVQYDTLVFATPVYWYSMSGLMKDFFDRISDLLKIEKATGRLLRGKNMALVSCSGSDDLVKGFSMPFVESADYLGMNYLGEVHAWVENDQIPEQAKRSLDRFVEVLLMLN